MLHTYAYMYRVRERDKNARENGRQRFLIPYRLQPRYVALMANKHDLSHMRAVKIEKHNQAGGAQLLERAGQ